MENILKIEKYTNVCSVALSSEGGILKHFEDFKGQNHAQVLSSFIEECIKYAKTREIKLDAIAVSIGPGSYTGLRIGLSEAKGLAFGYGIPLIGIDTLKLMSVSAMFNNEIDENSLLMPMIDARRMEVFTGIYDFSLNEIMKARPMILENGILDEYIAENKILIFGNGSDKAVELLANDKISHIQNIKPIAIDMLSLSEQAYHSKSFIDLAYSTPNYLKEFPSTVPKKNI